MIDLNRERSVSSGHSTAGKFSFKENESQQSCFEWSEVDQFNEKDGLLGEDKN